MYSFLGSMEESNGEKAVQLVSIKRNTGEQERIEFVLNESALQEVLSSCQNKKLCIIATVGSARSGKSLLANCIIERLRAVENQETFSLASLKSLSGFSFKPGYQPDTKGIWIWNRAFHVRGEEGEVAVLVLDTQGENEEFLSSAEFSTIFGISFLISSVLVVNVKDDLDDVPVDQFSWYTKYLDHIKSGTGSSLQTISILIRDWTQPAEYSYGSKGGKKYFDAQNHEVFNFQQYFDGLNCFLVPFCGENALIKNFCGDMGDLNPEFVKQLHTALQILTKDTNLKAKSLLGNSITGLEFRKLLSAYIEMFNINCQNGEDLDVTEPYKVTINTAVTLKTDHALATYRDVHLQKTNRCPYPYLEETAFKALDASARNKAIRAYKKYSIPQSIEAKNALKNLNEVIDKEYRILEEQNSRKKQAHKTECISKASNSFEQEMMAKFGFFKDKNDKLEVLNVYEDDFINQTASQIAKVVEQDFLSSFPEDEQSLHSFRQSMYNILESCTDRYISENKRRRGIVNDRIQENVKILMQEYITSMKDMLQNIPDAPLNVFEYTHNKEMSVVQNKFQTLCNVKNLNLKKLWWNELKNAIENKYLDMKLGLDSLAKKAVDNIEIETAQYKLELQNIFQESGTDNARLFHHDRIIEILEKFESLNPYPKNSDRHDALQNRLKDRLNSEFQKESELVVEANNKTSETLAEMEETYFDSFVQNMGKIVGQESFMEENDLEYECDKESKTVNENFIAISSSLNATQEQIQVSLDALKSKVEHHRNFLLAANIQKKSEAEAIAENICSICKTEFESKMNDAVANYSEIEDLRREHHTAKTTMFVQFRKLIGIAKASLCESYIEKLHIEAEKMFEEIESIFGMKLEKKEEENSLWNDILRETKTIYHEEMNQCFDGRHSAYSDTDLRQKHDRTVRYAISNSDTELTQQQKEKLRCCLEVSFENYVKVNHTISHSHTEPAIGIDLGTTYSCTAVYHNGTVQTITNGDGEKTTPSYVAFDADGSIVIGNTAKSSAHLKPENTVYDAKRIIGRRMDDKDLQKDIKMWPFKVVEENKVPKIKIQDKTYFPEEISAELLKRFKTDAEDFLGKPVKNAVITVPANFTDGQRQATRDAGAIAGFNILGVLNEPTAAALAYRVHQFQGDTRKNILVYDLGGGTFDVAILAITDKSVEVLSVFGDSHLGGEDFDRNLMELCAKDFETKSSINLFALKDSEDDAECRIAKRNLRRLQTECEKAKRYLTTARAANVNIDAFFDGQDYSHSVSRNNFENCNKALFERTIHVIHETMKQANLQKDMIHDVILVGGSTRIPLVQTIISNYFDGKELNKTLSVDEAVAHGAAIQAAMLAANPGSKPFDFDSIKEITTMSLGVETSEKEFDVIIPRHSKIPLDAKQEYRTSRHNQQKVIIRIFEGENKKAADNKFLGEFILDGIPPGPAEKEVVDVTMSVDRDGIVKVLATCRSTKGSKSITVTENKGRISEEGMLRLLG